jgi:hypothetical protein
MNWRFPKALTDAAHQSTSNNRVSGFLNFSYGFGLISNKHAFMVSFIDIDGFFIYFKNWISLGSIT